MKGQQVGYLRVSSIDQHTSRQLDGVVLDKVFEDKCSGKDTNRPGLQACFQFIREGDTLHVHSIDRLARNLVDLQNIVQSLIQRGVTVRFEKEALMFSGTENNAMNTLLLQMLGAVAQFERAMIRERQAEGILKAKAAGKHCGRIKKLSDDDLTELRTRRAGGESAISLARAFDISRASVYAYTKDQNS